MLSERIGKGVQTFRIKGFENLYTEVMDFGPDHENFLQSRKVIKLKSENKYYAMVEIPYKDVEQFIVLLENCNFEFFNDIDWVNVAKTTESCLWIGPQFESRFINLDICGG
ncbi:MAG: hypothetical protein JW864_17345 [Spirochaetes bacterium]|nr:hypothetical protein [Spirochaetota bacterium]